MIVESDISLDVRKDYEMYKNETVEMDMVFYFLYVCCSGAFKFHES